MASTFEPLLTVSDLAALPEDNNRYELIEGELFVSRAPSLSHQRVVLNLLKFFLLHLDQNPIGILVPGPGAVFSYYDGVIPDITFVRNERWPDVVNDEKISGPVDLMIEVLSPGPENRRRDLTAKRQLYGKYGAEEYWVVDYELLTVHVFRLGSGILVEVNSLKVDDYLTTPLLPDFRLEVKSIFTL